ncbi:Hypothetical protein NTJ_16204 [Nesidiocoris tenuis]|uniref:Spermatogenesis-associated protein 17 n=1 Tax=Nesidiocoris tenuis TaxID=355587 RepID=A0ABN7BGA9_9HEMI|nr:Hypothetical protein NTJ_16204 [Nesidiocoris tenuis]
MSSRLPIPEIIECTQEKIKKLKIEEQLVKRKKHFAAIKIQKLIRGWLTRIHLKKLNKKSVIIQKNWRGFRGRQKAAALVERRYKDLVEKYYFKMAVRIQALWRGFQARKGFDYYKKKAWLNAVADTNEETRKKLDQFRLDEEERKRKEIAAEYEPWIHYMANKVHHFLRTRVRPGIYSDPNSVEYSEIEKFIASYKYRGFMKDLNKERLLAAVRDLLARKPVLQGDGDACAGRIATKRDLATLRAQYTISNPCLDSSRK